MQILQDNTWRELIYSRPVFEQNWHFNVNLPQLILLISLLDGSCSLLWILWNFVHRRSICSTRYTVFTHKLISNTNLLNFLPYHNLNIFQTKSQTCSLHTINSFKCKICSIYYYMNKTIFIWWKDAIITILSPPKSINTPSF